jgi:hypothetical protein
MAEATMARQLGQAATRADSADLPIFDNAQAWYGPQMAARTDWIHRFSDTELAELDAAVMAADASGRDILEIGREQFPLPGLAGLLHTVRKEVLHGRGFKLFRGVPVERYTLRQSAIAYWGLGLYLGDEAVSQNGKGHVLGHVTNLGLDHADPETRGYQTSARLNYHTDSSDIVALLCLRGAKSGGLSSIVSSTTIWNELVRSRPDHARTLMGEFYRTRWAEIPAEKKGYASNPIFAPHKGRMITSYVRSAINKGQALAGVPRLTSEQIEALDHIDALAADPALHLDMEFRPGDIQVLTNHSIFHSRTAYEDWPEPDKRRHLLRLWLACEDGPELPSSMIERLGSTASGRPNGICVPGVPFVAPLAAA